MRRKFQWLLSSCLDGGVRRIVPALRVVDPIEITRSLFLGRQRRRRGPREPSELELDRDITGFGGFGRRLGRHGPTYDLYGDIVATLSRFAGGVIAVVLAAMLMVAGLSSANDALGGQRKVQEDRANMPRVLSTLEVDSSDPVAWERWAVGICDGVSVQFAAKSIGVSPRLDAVVGALTEGVPEEFKARIATICREHLIDDGAG